MTAKIHPSWVIVKSWCFVFDVQYTLPVNSLDKHLGSKRYDLHLVVKLRYSPETIDNFHNGNSGQTVTQHKVDVGDLFFAEEINHADSFRSARYRLYRSYKFHNAIRGEYTRLTIEPCWKTVFLFNGGVGGQSSRLTGKQKNRERAKFIFNPFFMPVCWSVLVETRRMAPRG